MIRHLRLTNVKAFAYVDLTLGRFTLLSGLNSSGKSTVLQSLGLLRQAYESHRARADGETTAPGLPLNGEYVDLGTGKDVLHEEHDNQQPLIGIELETDDGAVAKIAVQYEAEADALPIIGSPFVDAAWSSPSLSLVQRGFQYLRADRINPATTYARSYEMSARRGFLGTRGEYTIDYLRVHQDELVRDVALQHPGAGSHRLLAQVEAWLGEVCPGVRLSADAIDQTDLVRLGFRFSTSLGASNARRPTNVGFGLTYVLPVIIACLTARPGALVLLENPEAHVHPRGQSALAQLACAAASVGAQVIVETHSDHVLNGTRLAVKDAKLDTSDVVLHYFYRPESGGVEIASPEVGPDGMLSDWPEGFFDEWDTTLDKLLD
ncbi:AAA family ATPase [Cellulosimicrobium cellulans]|uniref:AAA family ATPase n=1 Tax=Cellulosimicrobium cellulans TaxID=1710 RepID=UPI0020978B78|nr:DUF3696 domain-containing protein [Cellulosimicrobium cellulans]MCO7272099.1 DUF3696 domain-containing protein [Cellulosimicrobium cellulans]